jgi:hypothetical protein
MGARIVLIGIAMAAVFFVVKRRWGLVALAAGAAYLAYAYAGRLNNLLNRPAADPAHKIAS